MDVPLAFRSPCPVASALDLVGDKWTLIVLRTIFAGRHRYSELADIPERIATNILADRLAWLEEIGLVSRTRYQDAPARYEYRLTAKGADLLPVLHALSDWACKHIPGRETQPDWLSAGRAERPQAGEFD
jgi:DNA-binding HxlR family transcriptional regulator